MTMMHLMMTEDDAKSFDLKFGKRLELLKPDEGFDRCT
jgi:hypothetical protein